MSFALRSHQWVPLDPACSRLLCHSWSFFPVGFLESPWAFIFMKLLEMVRREKWKFLWFEILTSKSIFCVYAESTIEDLTLPTEKLKIAGVGVCIHWDSSLHTKVCVQYWLWYRLQIIACAVYQCLKGNSALSGGSSDLISWKTC